MNRYPGLTPSRPDLEHNIYLGDGAYVGFSPHRQHTELWCTNGVEVTERIVLGEVEVETLMAWLKELPNLLV